ncbi:MAG: hypothetical protein CML13_16065 [Puniceicoccaceae bacterium]|nr:hypothetical protein [Puniceicoccaceae bacterium]
MSAMKNGNKTITEHTSKADLPLLFTDEQLESLEDDAWYPGYFYNSAIGLKRTDALKFDWERGIIDPESVRCLGSSVLGQKLTVGQKMRPVILGRELKRVSPIGEGRVIGTFSEKMERLAS